MTQTVCTPEEEVDESEEDMPNSTTQFVGRSSRFVERRVDDFRGTTLLNNIIKLFKLYLLVSDDKDNLTH